VIKLHIKDDLNFFFNSKFLILPTSLIYSILIGGGYIGFGIDYLVIYQKHNVPSPTMFDFIGWAISTLSITKIHLGAYATSFIISLSVGFVCRFFFNIMKLKSLIFFITIYFLILFSWPVVISSNNAMRQGLMMAFIFFSLIQLLNKKKNLSIFFFTISIFTHKSGVGYLLIFIYLIFFKALTHSEEIKRKNVITYSLILFFISLIYLLSLEKVDHDRFENNVIIGLNFVPFFALINIIYIFYFTIRYHLLKNAINLYLYFFSIHCLALLPSGLFWQFERYNMTLILIYIFIFATCVKNNQKYIYLITVFLLLLILTFLTGMYTEGVGIFPIY
jgi:hypothetical protein